MGKLLDQDKINIVNLYTKENKCLSQIANIFNISIEGTRKILLKRSVEMRSRKHIYYPLDETFFNKIDTHEKAYFLGILYADGCLYDKDKSIQLGLKESDKNILIELNKLIKSMRPLKYCIRKKTKKSFNSENVFVLRINNPVIYNQLVVLGCYPKKSLTLKFPNKTQVSENFMNSFLLGYMDGDGCIYVKNITKCSLSFACTHEFANKIKEIISDKFNIHVNIYHTRKNKKLNTYYASVYGRKQIVTILKWFYKDCHIKLERKWNKFLLLNTQY